MRTAVSSEPTVSIVLPPAKIQRVQTFAVGMFVVGAILCVIGYFADPELLAMQGVLADRARIWHSYLFAWLFWTGVTVGSLAALMLHHVVGGRWGFVLRGLLEAATRLLPLMLLLFVPVAFALLTAHLYSWVGESTGADPVLSRKHLWLSEPTFLF